MKKAELSLNIVVAAALAMIVLVILSVLIFNAGADLWSGTECEALAEGAVCIPNTYTCAEESDYSPHNLIRHRTASCPEPSDICCVPQ